MINQELRKKVKIGIITALDKEFIPIKKLLKNAEEDKVKGKGAGRRYYIGELPSSNGSMHYIALALADKGNNKAALRATLLLEHYPNVQDIILVGIAGGIPVPDDVNEHVRLGDIVISSEKGIVQYDFGKQREELENRSNPRPPSALMLEAIRFLEINSYENKKPWEEKIDYLESNLSGYKKPSNSTDILYSCEDSKKVMSHPEDKTRTYYPKIFYSPIASANIVQGNCKKRDKLYKDFKTKAVEMEGAGIADATWNHSIGYLVIRGICDYCDYENKNDIWHNYASLVAAAYTAALIESLPNDEMIEDNISDQSNLQKNNTLTFTDYKKELEDDFNFRWEPVNFENPHEVLVYWPVRLRQPTPIHAVQCFTVAGLIKCGCKVELWIDDLGNVEYNLTDFKRQLKKWISRTGVKTDKLITKKFSDVIQNKEINYTWEIIQKWFGNNIYRLSEILKISKLWSEAELAEKQIEDLKSRYGKRLMTPPMVWTCLVVMINDYINKSFVTLGGYDEKQLWEAWRQSNIRTSGLQIGHLYIPELKIKEYGKEIALHMARTDINWTSKEDIKKSLSEFLSLKDGKIIINDTISWFFNLCIVFPAMIKGEKIKIEIGKNIIENIEDINGLSDKDVISSIADEIAKWLL